MASRGLGRKRDRMNTTTFIAAMAVAALLCGCAAPRKDLSANYQQQLALHRSDLVPLPASTPFDTDPEARAMYLTWFQKGYRSGLTEYLVTCCFPPGPYPKAQQKGWSDGQLQGALAQINSTTKAK